MANKKSDKSEKVEPEKVETPAPAVEEQPTAMVAIRKAGLVVPTEQDVSSLIETSARKLEALSALLDDAALPAAVKDKVREIAAQANPVKPGMEEVRREWSVPRVQIAQPTTTTSAKPDSAKPGFLYTTGGQLLEQPFGFIPIYFNYENVMFAQGEKVPVCSSPDAKLGAPNGPCAPCPHLPFGQQNGGRGDQRKTDCQNQIVAAVLAADLSNVYIVTFAKTSRGAGSALLSLAGKHAFPWKQSFLLSTEKKTGEKGLYYVFKIEATGRDNSPDVIRVAQSLNDLYTVNRKLSLAKFYQRAGAAQQVAIAAEATFNGSALDAGLEEGEPDLSAPVTPTSSVRSNAKPM